jgi:hypothetical protein
MPLTRVRADELVLRSGFRDREVPEAQKGGEIWCYRSWRRPKVQKLGTRASPPKGDPTDTMAN